MPAPARYDSPFQQFARIAAEARRRGEDFDGLWERVVERAVLGRRADLRGPDEIVWPGDSWDGRIARAAMLETRGAWERAYRREPPTPREAAVLQVHGMIAADPTAGGRAEEGDLAGRWR